MRTGASYDHCTGPVSGSADRIGSWELRRMTSASSHVPMLLGLGAVPAERSSWRGGH